MNHRRAMKSLSRDASWAKKWQQTGRQSPPQAAASGSPVHSSEPEEYHDAVEPPPSEQVDLPPPPEQQAPPRSLAVHLNRVTANSAELSWDPVDGASDYNVSWWRPVDNDPLEHHMISGVSRNQAKIAPLSSNSSYQFLVEAVTGSGDLVARSDEVEVKTRSAPRAAELARDYLCQSSTGKWTSFFESKGGAVYEFNYRVTYECTCPNPGSTQCLHPRICEVSMDTLPSEFRHDAPRRRFMLLLGETESGKSTLLNVLVNAYFGVKFEDTFRLRVVGSEQSQVNVSQTRRITMYVFHPIKVSDFQMKNSLCIIDTPGFNDTRGLVHDIGTEDMLRLALCGSDATRALTNHVHRIACVIKASDSRLTTVAQYVYNRCLSLFASDVGQHIYAMLTYGSSSTTSLEVVQSIRDVGFPLAPDNEDGGSPSNVIPVDNAFLMQANQNSADRFYVANQACYRAYMDDYRKVLMEMDGDAGVALTRSTAVMMTRERARDAVDRLGGLLDEWLSKFQELQRLKRQVADHSEWLKHVEQTGERRTKVKKSYQKAQKKDAGADNNTRCQCGKLCHAPCHLSFDADKRRCAAMDDKGVCKVCGCDWTKHSNENIEYVEAEMEFEEIVVNVDNKYKENMQTRDGCQRSLEKIQREQNGLTESYKWGLKELKNHLDFLSESSLSGTGTIPSGIVKDLIAGEKALARPDMEERLQFLDKMLRDCLIAEGRCSPGD
eukprot:GHVU01017141.1.p1 GENE.GHVU01017141.1~~GHVU01017141.1.p1  ORF type:complete len:721 (-),score=103.77 GHVU01017141.1:350-2512(-)